MSTSMTVALKDLKPSKTNPRKDADDLELKELAASVKAHGILNPLTVRKIQGNGDYEVVAGSRRLAAAKLAGLREVPVTVHEYTDQQALEVQIVENLQREDVHPLDEAEGFKVIAKSKGIPYIAEKVGKSRRYVAERIALADLTPEAKKLLHKGDISLGVALVLVRVGVQSQKDFLVNHKWKLRSAEETWATLKQLYFNDLSQAPFDVALPYGKLIACSACPNQSQKKTDLFGTMLKGNMCLVPECFRAKVNTIIEKTKLQLKDQKVRFILVSENYTTENGVLNASRWVKPTAKCTEHVKGLIVDGKTLSRVGKVIDVCANEKCQACHSTAESKVSASAEAQKVKDREAAKKLIAEKRLRQTMFKLLWDARAKDKVPTVERVMFLIEAYLDRMSHDHARYFCKALGIDPRASKTKGVIGEHDFRSAIKVWMSEFGNADMFNVALMLGLVNALYVSASFTADDKTLSQVCTDYGVTKPNAKAAIEEDDKKLAAAKAAAKK